MVAAHQPTKLAAFEGHFTTAPTGTPLHLWGIPDATEQRVKYGVAIPRLLSFLTYGDWNRPMPALADYPRGDWPPVNLSFQTYHLMVALGVLFVVLTVYASILRWRGTLFQKRWLLWVFVFAVAGPMLANQAGWAAAEVGRQPWIVWGLLRTSDAASKAVSAAEVWTSLVMFGVIYLMLLLVWLHVMDRKIKAGPESPEDLARQAEQRGWLDVAAARAVPSGPSMTEARDAPEEQQER
jgi:cytochrome d ubiquinol oxidase subunit I